jgi:Kef-type K+ transport system membrane component KefB
LWIALSLTLGKVLAFLAFMLLVGRRVLPRILWLVARTGSRELFTLCVISAAVGVAYISTALFDVSFAIGAFFAGMMMRESELSHRAAEESLPLRDAFAVLFFVSIGMLFDPAVVIEEPAKLLAVAGLVMVGNPISGDCACSRVPTPLTLRSPSARASRRLASSPSSWLPLAYRSGCCLRKRKASLSPQRWRPSRRTRWCSPRCDRFTRGFAPAPALQGVWNAAAILSPSFQ